MNRKKALEQHAQGPIRFAILLWGMPIGKIQILGKTFSFTSGLELLNIANETEL